MECYAHPNAASVGVCRACGKGVCRACARDLGFGVACSDSCVKEATEVNEMTQRAKRIYGLGSKPPRVPLVVTMFSLFAIFLLGWSAYEYWWSNRGFVWFPLLFGVLCVALAALAYRRSSKLGLRY